MPGGEGKIYRQVILFLSTFFSVYIFDQASKFLAQKHLVPGESVPLVENIVHFTLVENTGAAFGMFKLHPNVFLFIAVCASAAISLLVLFKFSKLSLAERTALAFILAGALGNLTDRIRFGFVVDFVDLRVWPVFNAADSFITLGAFILLGGVFLQRKNRCTEN